MAMETPERRLLTDLRQALLRLHKTLLDWERTAYDRVHGRTTGHPLLQAILNDPQFAWLRPLSELIAWAEVLNAQRLDGERGKVTLNLGALRMRWESLRSATR